MSAAPNVPPGSNAAEAALDYARRGWAVIPLFATWPDGRCSCPKHEKCRVAGKHPRIGRYVQRNTRTLQSDSSLWSLSDFAPFTRPGWGVGVLCGTLSRLVVIDIDVKRHDNGLLASWRSRFAPTRTHGTPSGGCHLIYDLPDSAPPDASRTIHARGMVDVQGDGTYVVMPPSLGKAAHPYTVLDPRPTASINDWDYATFRQELLALEPLHESRHSGEGHGVSVNLCEAPSHVEVGAREAVLFAWCRELRDWDTPLDVAEQTIRRLWTAFEQSPEDEFTLSECLNKLHYVYRRYAPNPALSWELLEFLE